MMMTGGVFEVRQLWGSGENGESAKERVGEGVACELRVAVEVRSVGEGVEGANVVQGDRGRRFCQKRSGGESG